MCVSITVFKRTVPYLSQNALVNGNPNVWLKNNLYVKFLCAQDAVCIQDQHPFVRPQASWNYTFFMWLPSPQRTNMKSCVNTTPVLFYFCFLSQHSHFLFICSLLQCPCAVWMPLTVLKHSAVPSGDVLTFISWIYNKAPLGATLVFPPSNMRLLFGFRSWRLALCQSKHSQCHYYWCSDSLDVCRGSCSYMWVRCSTLYLEVFCLAVNISIHLPVNALIPHTLRWG